MQSYIGFFYKIGKTDPQTHKKTIIYVSTYICQDSEKNYFLNENTGGFILSLFFFLHWMMMTVVDNNA